MQENKEDWLKMNDFNVDSASDDLHSGHSFGDLTDGAYDCAYDCAVAGDSSKPQQPHASARAILSFVRRSARLDARLEKAKQRYSGAYLLCIADGDGSLRVKSDLCVDSQWIEANWGNANPLIVEIGSGQGENIVAAAAANPNTNFLALEVYDPGVAHTMLLAGKQDLHNLRIAQVNAPDFLAACKSGVLAEVWTFFPDPWPKMRHHKRRIVQPSLAKSVHNALVAGGVWRIATDIEDYALHVHEVMDSLVCFENDGDLRVSLPTEHVGKGNAQDAADLPHADFVESRRFDGRVLTNFERKGLEAGRVIHDFAYVVKK